MGPASEPALKVSGPSWRAKRFRPPAWRYPLRHSRRTQPREVRRHPDLLRSGQARLRAPRSPARYQRVSETARLCCPGRPPSVVGEHLPVGRRPRLGVMVSPARRGSVPGIVRPFGSLLVFDKNPCKRMSERLGIVRTRTADGFRPWVPPATAPRDTPTHDAVWGRHYARACGAHEREFPSRIERLGRLSEPERDGPVWPRGGSKQGLAAKATEKGRS